MARTEILQSALEFAIKAHAGQWRDGGSPLPYATHPVEVVANLRYVGGITDEELLTAAFLHDVLEETDTTPAQIGKAFGKRVRSLVESVTRYEPTEEERKGLTEEAVYDLRSRLLLEEIAGMSTDAQAIKLADRLSNVVGARATKTPEKQARYLAQTRDILRIIPRSVNSPLWKAVRKAAGLKKREI